MKYLSDRHLAKLKSSAITGGSIESSEAETINLKTMVGKGFKVLTPDSSESLLQEKYIESALYFPFFNMAGNKIFDEKTGKEIGIIRPDYTERALAKFKKLPKYLCLPKSVQSRFYPYFPKDFNWLKYIENHQKLENGEANGYIAVTEGVLKALSGTANGHPTVGLFSVFCFCENGLNTPLIPELRDLLKCENIDFSVIFDRDKQQKIGVKQAETALLEKAFLETGKKLSVIDLPQEEGCKGLDDFIYTKGSEALKELKRRYIETPIIKNSKLKLIPDIPKNALPDIYIECIKDTEKNIENCIEAVPMVLFTQGAGFIGNKAKLNSKFPNLYGETLAKTTGAKTTAANRFSYPLRFINKAMEKEYRAKLEAGEENVKSEELMIAGFTQAGIELTLNQRKNPVLVMLENSEFENFYSLVNAEYNSSLSSFITKAYDSLPLIPMHSKDNLQSSFKLNTIYDPAISIAGVHTFVSMLSSKPKGYKDTGFDNRFMKFIGKTRKGIRIPEIQPIPQKLEQKLLDVYTLVHNHFRNLDEALKLRYSDEAKQIYHRFYNQYKDFEDENPESNLLPYMRRSVCDFLPKLCLQFEIIERAELIVNNFEAGEWRVRFKQALAEDKLLISKEVMLKTIEWSKYFIESAKFIINNYYDSDSEFDSRVEKILRILKKFPKGILASSLKRDMNMHRKPRQGKEFDEILDYLQDMDQMHIQINPNNKRSKLVTLKKNEITNHHKDE